MNLILIAGGTASGKTTIAKLIYESVSKSSKINLISLDDYYYPFSHLKKNNNIENPFEINWDDPSTINFSLLKKHLQKLRKGEKIKKAKFLYNKNEYSKTEFDLYEPTKYIILEGIHAFFDDELIKQAKLKIYIHADSDLRLIRRIKRDSIERKNNFDPENFLDIWKNQIRFMHKKYIEPKKYLADIIISTNNNFEKKFNLKIIEILKESIIKDNLNSFN